jgi:hypothetical protein
VSATSSDLMENWLTQNVARDVFENDSYWRLVGDSQSNHGSTHSSADPINPIAERVVNAFEAVVELNVQKRQRMSGSYQPTSLQQALEETMGIPDGASRNLPARVPSELGTLVEMMLEGSRSEPTITVLNKGIGIHPDDFSNTILSLLKSEKGDKPYLIGMYGQGGSSTYQRSEYTLIFSRRNPDFLREGQEDLYGWTVVRSLMRGRRLVYEYLVDPFPQMSYPLTL